MKYIFLLTLTALSLIHPAFAGGGNGVHDKVPPKKLVSARSVFLTKSPGGIGYSGGCLTILQDQDSAGFRPVSNGEPDRAPGGASGLTIAGKGSYGFGGGVGSPANGGSTNA